MFTFQGSRDSLLDVGSMFAKKGGIPMDKYWQTRKLKKNKVMSFSYIGLAGSTREMGRHGATVRFTTRSPVNCFHKVTIPTSSKVTMATGSKNYSEVGDIKRWKGSNR